MSVLAFAGALALFLLVRSRAAQATAQRFIVSSSGVEMRPHVRLHRRRGLRKKVDSLGCNNQQPPNLSPLPRQSLPMLRARFISTRITAR